MSDNPVPYPPAFALFHRSSKSDPWRPLRKTASYSDAVAWIGVEKRNGDWVILPWGQIPNANLPQVKGEQFDHKAQFPAGLKTWPVSPPPNPTDRVGHQDVTQKPPTKPSRPVPATTPILSRDFDTNNCLSF